ncbi:Type I phosphatidylinositol 4,5-bisphosphate 4-phosphatase-B [Echinococcus granulosus]|uniref:Phosphatidylinositol-4,5-bisphosphate 4-phosphatase n=1 Tax=Echinococcus granulosus TaxID=6210 RepID=A0A068WHD4_ECHGR|nr:Type I phosphatidylinositol 4,5-bisphosphate 4-phosphatase-B [Echinococcus granulosus]CDS19512.1 transmembrane protein 55A [Echinococcus granulosus]
MAQINSDPSLNHSEEAAHFNLGSNGLHYYVVKPCPIEQSRANSPLFGFYHCQTCKLLLTVRQDLSRLAVVCSRCFEATPIRNPPPEKRFYRCICHCLLLVPRHHNIFACPRTSCRTVLVTEVAKKNPQLISNFLDEHLEGLKRPASLPNLPSLPDRDSTKTKDWRKVFISCGYCKESFKASPGLDLTAEILCPECKNVSAVTPRFPRRMTRQYILYGLFLLLVSSAITLGSYFNREYNSGVYCMTVGLFVVGAVLLLQALLYCTMPISTIISGAVGVD